MQGVSVVGMMPPTLARHYLRAPRQGKVRRTRDGSEASPPDQIQSAESSRYPATADRPFCVGCRPAQAGYQAIQDATLALSVEVPAEWRTQVGTTSEGDGYASWSEVANQSLDSSITAASDLVAWYEDREPKTEMYGGIYAVASRMLAQRYSDDELVSLDASPHDLSGWCGSPGDIRDFNRPPYSGKLREWKGCGHGATTFITLSVAPEGRDCVILAQLETASETDSRTVQHILDTLEVDCGALPE
jgi:hypothetical protein